MAKFQRNSHGELFMLSNGFKYFVSHNLIKLIEEKLLHPLFNNYISVYYYNT
jgi:hypothetical protein